MGIFCSQAIANVRAVQLAGAESTETKDAKPVGRRRTERRFVCPLSLNGIGSPLVLIIISHFFFGGGGGCSRFVLSQKVLALCKGFERSPINRDHTWTG